MESLNQTQLTADSRGNDLSLSPPRPTQPPAMAQGRGNAGRGFSLNITLRLRPFTFAVHLTPPVDPATISGYTI